MEAQQWADKAENKDELAAIMGQAAVDQLSGGRHRSTALKGKFDYGTPARVVENSPQHHEVLAATTPPIRIQSHDLWFLTEDIRWGKYEASFDTKALIAKVNREDHLAARPPRTLGVAAADIPASTSRGKETFFDGKVFDPENPAAYLKSPAIKRVEV